MNYKNLNLTVDNAVIKANFNNIDIEITVLTKPELLEVNNPEEYLKEILHKEHIERIFTAVRGQTGIDKNGVKVDGSLRYTRVLTKNNVVFHDDSPVEFVADIHIVSED